MLTPRDERDLAQAVADAQGPLWVQGGGTRCSGRRPKGEVLSVAGLTGITLYEPGALTMVAQAGTPLAEIESALEAEGQMLPFEPYSLGGVTGSKGDTTIGGVFATNASGARRVQVGAARDLLLGVRFVDGRGEVLRNGGRVMKNVTGYDLVKLLAGSRGALGVLTEVSFKVLPKPEALGHVALTGLSDAAAVQPMAAAMGSPFDVSGAVHAPEGIEEEPTTLLRVEGFADSVTYRTERLRDLLARFGAGQIGTSVEPWQAGRALSAFSQTVRGRGGATWFVSVKPGDAPALMGRIAGAYDCLYDYDWAGGRIRIHAMADQRALHDALRAAVAAIGGHATLIHAPSDLADAVPLCQPEPAPLAALSKGVRAQFDPRGILNPGVMG